MVASKRKVAWDKQAAYAFGKAIAYIRKDSDQSAEKVKRDILQKIDKLPEQPEAHALDKYKINNNGTYRVFELHRYRISYLIKENEIIIVRIRHTSQHPLEY